MAKFLASAVFSGGITVAMYDGHNPQAVVYKTEEGDEKNRRRRSTVLQRRSFQSRAQMRTWVAGYRPKERV